MPSRARSVARSPSLRLAARAQRLRRQGDGQEARGVDQQRDPRAAGGREQAAEDGAEGETQVAGRLDAPVGRGDAAGPGRGGTSANSAGCASATPTPSSAVRASVAARPPKVERQHGRDRRLPERDVAQQPPALDAVGEQPRRPAEDDRGRPQRDEQPGDRDPRSRALLHIERERDEAEEVAERGEAHRAGEQTAIAHGSGAGRGLHHLRGVLHRLRPLVRGRELDEAARPPRRPRCGPPAGSTPDRRPASPPSRRSRRCAGGR